METRASYILVGAFILAFVIAMALFVFWLAALRLHNDTQSYRVYSTNSVTGLNAGSVVRYQGVPVGEVTHIRIDPENVEQVEITLDIDREVEIKSDARAKLQFLGITGVIYVQISGGTQEASPLKPRFSGDIPVIPFERSAIDAITDSIPELFSDLAELSEKAKDVLSETNRYHLAQILANLHEGSADFGDFTREARDTLKELRMLAAGLNADRPVLVTQLSETLVTMQDEARRAGNQFEDTLQDYSRAAQQLEFLVAENRAALTRFIQDDLSEVSYLMTDMRQASQSARKLMDDLRARQGSFLFGSPPQGIEIAR